jgi:Nif-specific regulatory protein
VEQVTAVRTRISRGILAEAIATGEVVETGSAMLDSRFSGRESVHRERIEAVLCVPIGANPPLGALYLQGREEPGHFSSADKDCAVLFATHLAPLADSVLMRRAVVDADDPTRRLRESMHLEGIVGRSPALAALLREVSLVAPLDVSVLLTGDSGTGKSQIARVIHDNGPRARGPFVELNCAAVPETLLESELFGALPGSHATATRRIPGKVAAAESGTLFLDEVGELAPGGQAKLLQLLHSRHYYPLGATQLVRADVRIIAATNADLDVAVAQGRFRQDLLHRLRVLPLRVPSLAERRSDLPELARHFCASACARHALPRLELAPTALRAVEAAEWPGNARQLAHAIEAAAIRAAGERAPRIERRHVFPERARDGDPEAAETFQEATRRLQGEFVRQALDATGWNITETARRLELSRSHLYNLIHAHGLRRTQTT